MTLKEIYDLITHLPEADDDQIWVWALKRCSGNSADAEDLYQSTMLALLEETYPWKEKVPFRAQAYWVMRRLKSKEMKKPDTTRLALFATEDDLPEKAASTDPEQILSVKRADEVYEAVRAELPESFTRELWEVMYVNEVYSIKEQVEMFGADLETKIYTARKLIKSFCRKVFKRFGFTFRNVTKGE